VRRWPAAVEIKRTLAPKAERGFRSAIEDIAPQRSFVVYPGSKRFRLASGIEAVDLAGLCEAVKDRA
jgi:hypothetical protein